MLRDGGRTQPPPAGQGCPLAPRRPALLTQVTKGLCRKSSRSSETVTSMSPELGRRREAAGSGPAHSGDKGAEPMARRPAARRALPTGQTMRGSSLPRPAPGAHAGPLAAVPPLNGNRTVFPRRARSAAATRVPQAKASHTGRGGEGGSAATTNGREQRSGGPAGQLRADPQPLCSGRPGTCGGVRPSPSN